MITKFFRDDHNRTLRVVVSDAGSVSLSLVEEDTGDTVYFPENDEPTNPSGIENCSPGYRGKLEVARTCPHFQKP